ncbi:MAG: methyltransferase domain-containing protein [Bacteroidia bacterium]|nr:methyltransferase domain-containing protein [Bacteroidia bacterium]
MSTKHYNIKYLENTGEFLKKLKEFSYEPFLKCQPGLIVDVGCGTGMDVINMANLIGKSGNLMGIDHDQTMIDKANLSKGNLANVEFLVSEVNSLPLMDDSVEGLRAERLIQHLTEPQSAIGEMYRVLKKNQPLVIVETDWAGLTIYNEHTEAAKKLTEYLTEVKINNGYASRKLTSYLKNAGFNTISISIFSFVIKSLKEANEYLWLEHILNEATKKGYLSTDENNEFVNSLKSADENGYFACCLNMVIANCIK